MAKVMPSLDGGMILAAALDYAALGWPLFPVPPGTKRSHKAAQHSGGRKWGATADPDEIRRDWRRWPDANLGLVTGPSSGFFVVEADTAQGHGTDGVGHLAALIEDHGEWPDTIEALSPSGSWHIYLRWPEGTPVQNSASRVAPGVDVRGEGGMVLAPPSAKPGAPLPYRWKNPPGDFEVAECPAWLLDLCRPPAQARPSAPPSWPAMMLSVPGRAASSWARTALQQELKCLAMAREGTRNDTLFRAAFSLAQIVKGGGLKEEVAREKLTQVALWTGLEPSEIAATIDSAFRAGLAAPRGPKSAGRLGRGRL